ncbi:MAG TPA: P-II family nitrogen regulator, partial [Candidatus Cybelea sp.]|nr:P-II family nitrogen regulator [Candidatus Cybelea sp.]
MAIPRNANVLHGSRKPRAPRLRVFLPLMAGTPAREVAMKKIEAVIKPFKLDEVREALSEVGV